ncbi:MAG: hypothetical protein JJU05_15635 [Verrucomicrobia bacterium]|nr:hypothetical protein [Verrucomicrobiota bacterium]MCH8528640.1 hypothetical protein [Kiritimatiellia bacterium]
MNKENKDMQTILKKIGILLSAGCILGAGGTAHASSIEVNFGSNRDGFGGFTPLGWGSFTEETDSILYQGPGSNRNRNSTLMTGALTGENALSRAEGSSHTFVSVIQFNSTTGSGASRNVSMVLFGDQVGTNGISLKLHEARNSFQIDLGLNNFSSESTPGATKTWGGAPFASGAVFTLEGTVRFTADDVFVTFTLTDHAEAPFSDTVARTIPISSLSGDFHGFGSRNRGLNFEAQRFTTLP